MIRCWKCFSSLTSLLRIPAVPPGIPTALPRSQLSRTGSQLPNLGFHLSRLGSRLFHPGSRVLFYMESYLKCNYLRTVSLSVSVTLSLPTYLFRVLDSKFFISCLKNIHLSSFLFPSSTGFSRVENSFLSSFPCKCIRMFVLSGWSQISVKQLVTVSVDTVSKLFQAHF